MHLPVRCAVVQEWQRKNQDSSADVTWLLANTKACPKCKNPIEKNGGCMHMTCRKPGGCGHEFCWICLQDWKGHKQCNNFKQEESQNVKDARTELQRYAHFFERYRAHEKAQEFASSQLREHIEQIMQAIVVEGGVPLKTAEFLEVAVDEIVNSRRFLKWTYAHAFMKNLSGREREFFEFNQAQLEGTLERLSDLMENHGWSAYLDPDVLDQTETFPEVRAQVVSLTGVVQKFFASLAAAMSKAEEENQAEEEM
jgi:ariadne-1